MSRDKFEKSRFIWTNYTYHNRETLDCSLRLLLCFRRNSNSQQSITHKKETTIAT